MINNIYKVQFQRYIMKRFQFLLCFVSLVLLFSLGFVSAQNTCDNIDDIIFRLDAVTNAHGEVFDGAGNYNEEICHNEVFGFYGDGNRVCSGSNLVLRLDAVTNAHGEIPDIESPAYNTNVCYGNMVCRSVDINAGACDIANGEELVATLSSDTNGHLASFGAPVGDEYPIQICCSSMALGDPEWRDGAGAEIGGTTGNPSYLDDIVWMQVDTPGILDGDTVSFSVSEEDLFIDDDISDLITAQGVNLDVFVVNGEAVVYFQITQEIIDAAEVDGAIELYFEASWGTFTATSAVLIVNDFENPEPPHSIIGTPEHGQVYYSGIELGFTSLSYDDNGVIEDYVWEFNDGGIDRKYCSDTSDSSCDGYTNAEGNFDYTYTNSGLSTITLTVTDNEGLSDKAQVAILVISSPGIFGWIDTPGFDKVVYWDPVPGSQGEVEFSAEQSYVVQSNSDGCEETLTCVAGDCPGETYVPCAPGEENNTIYPGSGGFAGVDFQWTINENQIDADGDAVYSVTYPFGAGYSDSLNDKQTVLSLTYEGIGSEVTTRDFTLGYCIDNGGTYLEVDSGGNLVNQITTQEEGNYDCSGGDGNGGTDDDCCPIFAPVCADDDGDDEWRCRQRDDSVASVCEDYTTLSACTEDAEDVAENSPTNTCEEGTEAGTPFCTWNSGDSKCSAFTPCITQDLCVDPTCNLIAEAGECIGGFMIVTYSGGECLETYPDGTEIDYCGYTETGNDFYCESQEYIDDCADANTDPITVPCGRLNFDLGFFDYAHFLSAMLIISMVYLFMHFRKEERE